ncbi:MAG: sulfate adenylyltransferase [Deltaproteobacteria bacterium]|nr:sulfate adenylyltransferase [Deltaproteobacteria bacterium]
MTAIAPHGGVLVDRVLRGDALAAVRDRAEGLVRIEVDDRVQSDIEMIAVGAFSPLKGFVGSRDWKTIVEDLRLEDGTVWSIPVTLSVSAEKAAGIREGTDVALVDAAGKTLALLSVAEKYRPDKEREAREVYRTTETAHPGVKALLESGEVNLAGEIQLVDRPDTVQFPAYHRDPAQVRAIFADRGWKRIVAFQTRNPVHRAHEYLQKCAMEMVDGLLLHPLVGKTKSDDTPAGVRMRCYEVLLDGYYPKDRVVLSVYPAAMRYGGPREAIFHAIARKNYGCTHFIVGRDHAGVGSYYGTYDAHAIFDRFAPGELGIQPVFFDNAFYCRSCSSMASLKTCPHDPSHHVSLSGTKVREMLSRGEPPPAEFSRPEVARVLIDSLKR